MAPSKVKGGDKTQDGSTSGPDDADSPVPQRAGADENGSGSQSGGSDQPETGGMRRVDPRLQARRRSVARETGRRRLWVAVAVAIAATLSVTAIAVAKSALFDVELVEVAGARQVDIGQVVQSSGIVLGQPLVDIDIDAATIAVESVPWVLLATVERSWGGTVTISVTERNAILAIPTGPRFVLVDVEGRQLEVVSDQPPEMLSVSGVEASGVPGDHIPEAARALLPIVSRVPDGLRSEIVGWSVEEEEVFAQLEVGGQARFGDARELEAKLAALDTVLLRVDLSCLDTIDVRVPRSPTVSRKTLLFEPKEPNEWSGGC